MHLFFSYYQLILIPLWPVLWDYKVPIFEVPIMGTFTNSDVVDGRVTSAVAETAVRTHLSKDCMHQRSGGKGIPVMAGRD